LVARKLGQGRPVRNATLYASGGRAAAGRAARFESRHPPKPQDRTSSAANPPLAFANPPRTCSMRIEASRRQRRGRFLLRRRDGCGPAPATRPYAPESRPALPTAELEGNTGRVGNIAEDQEAAQSQGEVAHRIGGDSRANADAESPGRFETAAPTCPSPSRRPACAACASRRMPRTMAMRFASPAPTILEGHSVLSSHSCGGVAERLKAAVLKTAGPKGLAGSNPASSANRLSGNQLVPGQVVHRMPAGRAARNWWHSHRAASWTLAGWSAQRSQIRFAHRSPWTRQIGRAVSTRNCGGGPSHPQHAGVVFATRSLHADAAGGEAHAGPTRTLRWIGRAQGRGRREDRGIELVLANLQLRAARPQVSG
jgi:hypothetical protein